MGGTQEQQCSQKLVELAEVFRKIIEIVINIFNIFWYNLPLN